VWTICLKFAESLSGSIGMLGFQTQLSIVTIDSAQRELRLVTQIRRGCGLI